MVEGATSGNMLLALAVIVDRLCRGKEHCPAPLAHQGRRCLEPPPPTACLPAEQRYYGSLQEPAAFLIHPLHLCLPLPVTD